MIFFTKPPNVLGKKSYYGRAPTELVNEGCKDKDFVINPDTEVFSIIVHLQHEVV